MNEGSAVKIRDKVDVRKFAIWAVFVLMCIMLAIAEPVFISVGNIMNVLRQISIHGFIAVGMMFIIISGGIDLSAGSIVGLSAVVAASCAAPGMSPVIAVIAGIVAGAACGLLSGLTISFSGIAPFIVTLGMTNVVKGIALVYTGGSPITNLSTKFTSIGGGFLLKVPTPIWILLLAILIGAFLLNCLKFGRHVFAVGGNELSAQVSGVNVKFTKTMAYVIGGAFFGLAGIVLSSRVMAGSPIGGDGYELDAIATCTIGGCSSGGGSGSISGVIAGMLIMGVIQNGMNLLDISSYYQMIVKGAIIVLAVLLDKKICKR